MVEGLVIDGTGHLLSSPNDCSEATETCVGALQRSKPGPLAHSRRRPHHPLPIAGGAHDSARITEIPSMSSLFISTID